MSALDTWLFRVTAAVVLAAAALSVAGSLEKRSARAGRRAQAQALLQAAQDHAEQPALAATLLAEAAGLRPHEAALRAALVTARVNQVLAEPGVPKGGESRGLAAGLMGARLEGEPEARRQVALAKLALGRGERKLARAHLEEAAKTSPDLAVLHLHRGVLHFGQKDYGAAAAALEKAIAADPELALARLTLGQVHAARKDWGPAARQLAKAAPALDDATAWFALGRAYAAQEQWADAEQALRGALKKAAQDGAAHGLLGRVLHRAGRGSDAVPHLTLAYQKAGDLDAYALLGRIYHDLKRHRDAAGVLGDVARLRPNDPEPMYVMALAAEGMGDLKTARGALRDAVERSGDDPDFAEVKAAATQRLAIVEQALSVPAPTAPAEAWTK